MRLISIMSDTVFLEKCPMFLDDLIHFLFFLRSTPASLNLNFSILIRVISFKVIYKIFWFKKYFGYLILRKKWGWIRLGRIRFFLKSVLCFLAIWFISCFFYGQLRLLCTFVFSSFLGGRIRIRTPSHLELQWTLPPCACPSWSSSGRADARSSPSWTQCSC